MTEMYKITHIKGSEVWKVYKTTFKSRFMGTQKDWVFLKAYNSAQSAEKYISEISDDYETSEFYDRYGRRISPDWF